MRRMPTSAAILCVFAATLALGACRGTPPKEEAPAETGTEAGTDTSSLDREVAEAGADESTTDPGPHEGVLAKRVIFFDFDSAEIRGDGPQIVAAHAKHLASRPGIRVRLEGHTDERGSREYNIGLGERRAQAVRRALMLQGAGEVQLSTVSYGEERPVATGTDEAAWTQNRRVELIYIGG
jgi:peptidoglycan-associated lipoprotein